MATKSTISQSEDICLEADGKILYKQAIVPSPKSPKFEVIATKTQIPSPKQGENILVFIPTANKFKNKAIKSKIESQFRKDENSRLIFHQQDIESGVGNQPYDENGVKGACTRIRNSLSWIQKNEDLLAEKKIGTVLVGAIENFIQRSENGPAVDYGVIVIYNATTQKLAGSISRGVTVPQAFLEEAEGLGFDDEGRKSGKVTVGELMAKTFGIDKANWHEVVCGVSRYTLLEEALDSVEVPCKTCLTTP